MKNTLLFPIMLGLALVLSACTPAATPTATPVPPNIYANSTDTPAVIDTSLPVQASGSAASLAVATNSSLGSFLIDSKGMTLYLFTSDTPGLSTCYGSCASYWPPLLTTGAPVAGSGVDAAMLGTITRTDGTTQVTYNSWPLYYYSKDSKAGDTAGEAVQGTWYVITPAGSQK
jgi:predicted lipoprotein with Yx(FWY)xxD motif